MVATRGAAAAAADRRGRDRGERWLLFTPGREHPAAAALVAYVVFGIGFGLVNAPITNTAVSGMPRAQAGVAAAVASTSRQVGSALGVAVLGSLVTSQLATSFGDFAAAARPAWVVVIGCGLVVVALGVVGTTTGRERPRGVRPSGSPSRFPRRPGLRRAERALGSAARSGTARLTPE